VFNNGVNRPAGSYSSVDMFEPPVVSNYQYPITANNAYGPGNLSWTYTATVPTNLYANNISGAQPLANGSFIITDGPNGDFFEVDSTNQTKWEYVNPVTLSGPLSQGTTPSNNSVFRCEFYQPNYQGFNGHTLTPGVEIELNPVSPSLCTQVTSIINTGEEDLRIAPNPVVNSFTISLPEIVNESFTVQLFDIAGKLLYSNTSAQQGMQVNTGSLSNGLYLLQVSTTNQNFTKKIVISR
jgi:hypothetical protein